MVDLVLVNKTAQQGIPNKLKINIFSICYEIIFNFNSITSKIAKEYEILITNPKVLIFQNKKPIDGSPKGKRLPSPININIFMCRYLYGN